MPQILADRPLLSCDAAQLQLELRDLAAMVPTSAFRLGELAAAVRTQPAAMGQLVAYLEFLDTVPTARPSRFCSSVDECVRLARACG